MQYYGVNISKMLILHKNCLIKKMIILNFNAKEDKTITHSLIFIIIIYSISFNEVYVYKWITIYLPEPTDKMIPQVISLNGDMPKCEYS